MARTSCDFVYLVQDQCLLQSIHRLRNSWSREFSLYPSGFTSAARALLVLPRLGLARNYATNVTLPVQRDPVYGPTGSVA